MNSRYLKWIEYDASLPREPWPADLDGLVCQGVRDFGQSKPGRPDPLWPAVCTLLHTPRPVRRVVLTCLCTASRYTNHTCRCRCTEIAEPQVAKSWATSSDRLSSHLQTSRCLSPVPTSPGVARAEASHAQPPCCLLIFASPSCSLLLCPPPA